jgi:hypothetical protein
LKDYYFSKFQDIPEIAGNSGQFQDIKKNSGNSGISGQVYHPISFCSDLEIFVVPVRYLVVSAEIRMGRFLNVYANIILANLYSTELNMCRD